MLCVCWVTAGLGAGWFCERGFLQFIFWFQFSGSWNQGLLDLLLMLVGGFWCSLVIILECVELFAFFYGAGPLPLSPLNTMTGGTLTLVQLQCNCCDYSLIRRNGLAANGPHRLGERPPPSTVPHPSPRPNLSSPPKPAIDCVSFTPALMHALLSSSNSI